MKKYMFVTTLLTMILAMFNMSFADTIEVGSVSARPMKGIPSEFTNNMRTPDAPVVTIEKVGENLKLDWEDITGAASYQVYEADTPEGPWAPIMPIVLTSEYLITNPVSKKFYYVLAIEGEGPDMPENFIFVEGGTINTTLTVASFYMDKYELTQEDYQVVMEINPAADFGEGADYPVYNVTWLNAIEYCNRRSMMEGLTPCYSYSTFGTDPDDWPAGWLHTNVACDFDAPGYRLPKKTEWEYAARGGLQTHGYTYSGSNSVEEVAWYSGNNDPLESSTKPVGNKAPNELGLYDMSGNVWEWCWETGTRNYRTVRGGCFIADAFDCTVVRDFAVNAITVLHRYGFRVCRNTP